MTEQQVLKYQCPICKFKAKNSIGFAFHISQAHYITMYEFLEQYLQIPICPFCHKEKCKLNIRPFVALKRNKHFYMPYCSNLKCRGKYFSKIQTQLYNNNEQLRQKLRQVRFNYLKKKTGKTAWERRAARQMSYLEQWFFDNVIVKYNLTQKYDIISEMPQYPYFIDFAFNNIKLAVQLDGKCHFIHGDKRIAHDIKKNQHLIQHGWKIFRISYKEVNENTIQNFLQYITQFKILPKELIENKVYNYAQYKEFLYGKRRTMQDYLIQYRQQLQELNRPLVELVLNSDIDFTKLGWVSKVSKLINKPTQKVSAWMKKYMPDFYKTCFHRK